MTKNAPIPAYTWTFEPAVPACERTFLVAEMLQQHTRVQNRQSAEKTKQPRYFLLLTWHPCRNCPPTTTLIKGTLKEQKKGELGRKERKEKVKRGDLRERKVLLHLGKDSKLKSTATFLGISFLLFPCIFILWVVKEMKLETRERDSIEPLLEIIEESKEEQAQRRSKGIVIKEHN
ncbi:hypothetical protein GQ457_09G018670 [Hibiscus cannabinus]